MHIKAIEQISLVETGEQSILVWSQRNTQAPGDNVPAAPNSSPKTMHRRLQPYFTRPKKSTYVGESK